MGCEEAGLRADTEGVDWGVEMAGYDCYFQRPDVRDVEMMMMYLGDEGDDGL